MTTEVIKGHIKFQNHLFHNQVCNVNDTVCIINKEFNIILLLYRTCLVYM